MRHAKKHESIVNNTQEKEPSTETLKGVQIQNLKKFKGTTINTVKEMKEPVFKEKRKI